MLDLVDQIQKCSMIQEKSHVLVLVANAFQAGLDAGTGIAKLAEGR